MHGWVHFPGDHFFLNYFIFSQPVRLVDIQHNEPVLLTSGRRGVYLGSLCPGVAVVRLSRVPVYVPVAEILAVWRGLWYEVQHD